MNVMTICMAVLMATLLALAIVYCKQRIKTKKLETYYKQELIIKQNVIDTLNKEVSRLNKKISGNKRKDVLDDLRKQ